MGEDVSSIKAILKLAGVNLTEGLQNQQQSNTFRGYDKINLKITKHKPFRLDGGSRLALGSAVDLDSLNHSTRAFHSVGSILQQDLLRQEGSLSKRKWVDSRSDADHQSQYALGGEGSENCRSRDQMPPPPVRMRQSFLCKAGKPAPVSCSLDSQQNHVDGTQIFRAPVTPQLYASEVGLSRTVPAPDSSSGPSNMSLAGAGPNKGQSRIDQSLSPRVKTGTAGPICARGGWQPPANSVDAVSSGIHSSPRSLTFSTGHPSVRRPAVYHKGSLMCPIDRGGRTTDPSDSSFQSIYNDGSSSYHRERSPLAFQSQLDSPALSYYHNSCPNQKGQISLLSTPSFAHRHSSKKAIGLSSHIRSSSRHRNNPPINSSSHRQQLKISTPSQEPILARSNLSTRQQSYRTSLPSIDKPRTEILRASNSFESGSTPVIGEMRPYFSTNSESLLRAQTSHTAHIRGRAPFLELQVPGPRRRANR